ncbi:MAG: membrane-bound PQQ-dependent dehydrogenase, glucose/quinate/shikimate family, partial [Candidatus Binatia bacterium]
MLIWLTSIVLFLIGLALGAGGIWLAALGGSWYYILAAIGFLLTAVLLSRRSASALWVYALVILGSLGWAVYEVGFDWWQLGARGGIIVLLGFWMLTPWIRKPLNNGAGDSGLPLAAASVIAVVVAGYAITQDSYNIAGDLPTEKVAATPDLGGNVPDGEWHQYGRTPYGQRYSPLAQITPENVSKLQVAWQYQTGDVKQPQDVGETTYQVTPLKIGDSLYLCTPHNWAIALDAATGKEKWKFDPKVGFNTDRQHQTCRGVSYWKDATATAGAKCAERVYLPTSDARLIALD